MKPVGGLCCQYHFTIAGEFQPAWVVGVIQKSHPSNLNAIHTDGDFRMQGNIMIPAPEFDLMRREQYFLIF